jgi:signal transduction histidine kinase
VKSRNRLMRGFTHDLKNPIGAADGHASLLEDGLLGNLSEQQLNSVQRIRASLANALNLIDSLNEFARAEAGRLELRSAPTQVTEIAREIAEQYRAIAEQSEVMVDLELNKVPIISSDDDRIRQILGNLVSNAIKYTRPGGRLCVRTDIRSSELSTNCVVIEVEDTGIGIPADKTDMLFEEFERIDPSVKPGIGLGLAISRRVARALGGEITVQSTRGVGSTFTLWLPNAS